MPLPQELLGRFGHQGWAGLVIVDLIDRQGEKAGYAGFYFLYFLVKHYMHLC